MRFTVLMESLIHVPELRLDCGRGGSDHDRTLLAGLQQRRFRDPMSDQVLNDSVRCARPAQNAGSENRPPTSSPPDCIAPSRSRGPEILPGFGPTARTGFHLRPMRRDLDQNRRNIEYLPFVMGRGGHVRQARPTLGVGHHRVNLRVIRGGHPFQSVTPIPRLTALRLLTRLTQTGRPLRFGVSRHWTAVCLVWPGAGLQVFQRRHLRLHLPGQVLHLLTHLGKEHHHRVLPSQEGAMDLVTGRESQVHGRSINSRAASGNGRIGAGRIHPRVDLTGGFPIKSPSVLLGCD